MQHDRIAVVDFGGQYAHLIATKVRRLKVRADILDPQAPIEDFRDYQGIILSGSPALSATGEMDAYTREIYDLPIPILGFCFGHQEIAKHYGGKVEHTKREYGFAHLQIIAESPIFAGLGAEETVWMSHGDTVTELPPDFLELGFSTATASGMDGGSHRNAAIASEALRRYGFQFHPEVDDTEHGQEMLANFALGICGCRADWTAENYAAEQAAEIRARAGDQRVFLLASGGVDSTVLARLLVDTLGPERVHLLHIDNGLMRKDESRGVIERFRGWGITDNLHFRDASDAFLAALAGIVEPEAKRIAIGNTFIAVCEAEMKRLGVADALLAQGTIYPDTIETGGTSRADVIKTHHNRVPLVEEMIRAGRVLEPLRNLYKVEVRELGAALGIEPAFIHRHPFPGPGLGVRLLCSPGWSGVEDAAAARAEIARIDAAAEQIAVRFSLGARTLPIRSVGVKADLRSYEWPVLLYNLAGQRPPSWSAVLDAANHIYKEITGVNRCAYDLTERAWDDGSPGGIHPQLDLLQAFTTRERLDLLRAADAQVMEGLARHDLMDEVWQCPTVMLPLSVNGKGGELVVLRPVLSERAMTARPAQLPPQLVTELVGAILPLAGVSGLCIDVTTKPPGTIEWE